MINEFYSSNAVIEIKNRKPIVTNNRFYKNIKFKKIYICIKGSDRLCKVVELSMQWCGILLSDSFETY